MPNRRCSVRKDLWVNGCVRSDGRQRKEVLKDYLLSMFFSSSPLPCLLINHSKWKQHATTFCSFAHFGPHTWHPYCYYYRQTVWETLDPSPAKAMLKLISSLTVTRIYSWGHGMAFRFLSKRNSLWAHSTLTSSHFFFPSNKPAMLSAPLCYRPPKQVPVFVFIVNKLLCIVHKLRWRGPFECVRVCA